MKLDTPQRNAATRLPNESLTVSDFVGIRDRFPFRLGATSYLRPADILPNVRLVSQIVDDIELVIFESDAISNLPDPGVVDELRALAAANRLTYTLHLPMDVHLGHADATERRAGVGKCLRVMERMRPLQPVATVLHFHHDARADGGSAADLSRWRARLSASVSDLLASGVAPSNLCVETLSYPFEWVEDIVTEHDLAVCLDLGHILLNGYHPFDYIDRYWVRTRVVHLHGILDGRDHRDISLLDRRILADLMDRLCARAQPPVLTIEVFNETDLIRSLQRLEEFAR